MSDFAQQLTAILPDLIRSAGAGGLTTAADLRSYESRVIDAVGALEIRARGSRIFTGELYGSPVDPTLGLEGDLFIETQSLDLYTFMDGVWIFLINLMPRTSAFVPVVANAYGTHPAFSTEREWLIWLTQHGDSGTGTPNITPAAPTVAFNASLRMLTASAPTGYTLADLEYQHGSNGAYQAYAAVAVDGNAHVANEWQFRVKAAAGRNPSLPAGSPAIGAAASALPILLAYDGNSLLANDTTPPNMDGTDIPALVHAKMLLAGRNVVSRNFAVSGQTTTQMLTDVMTQIDPLATDPAYSRHILVVNEWRNDTTVGYSDATDAYNRIVNYLLARKAAGWEILLANIIPSTSFLGNYTVQAFEDARQTVNALYASNWRNWVDNLCDFAALTLVAPDGTHPNEAGRRLEANVAFARLIEVIDHAVPPPSDPAVPDKVTGVSLLPGSAQITAVWSAPNSNGPAITDYMYEVSTAGGAFINYPHVASTALSALLTGLSNGVQYGVKIAAKNSIGVGPFSDVVLATPAATPPNPTYPPQHYAIMGGNSTRMGFGVIEDSVGFSVYIRMSPAQAAASNPAVIYYGGQTLSGLITNSPYSMPAWVNGVPINGTDCSQLGTNDWVLLYFEGNSASFMTVFGFNNPYGDNYYSPIGDIAYPTHYSSLWTPAEIAASANGVLPTAKILEQWTFTDTVPNDNGLQVVGRVSGELALLAGPSAVLV